jgi:hypothetical protein
MTARLGIRDMQTQPLSTKGSPRVVLWFECLLLAVASALLCLHTLPSAWRTLNTDFPNYYLAAQLAHQGYDTSQAYDWRWLQREKDHRAIDQRVIGLAPITPFSTFFVWPLTALAPLQAKHIWLILQLLLLIPIALALRSLTGEPLRRIALIVAACFPLHRNLLYGQYYILLLGMLVAACWAYRERRLGTAGALIGLATLTKVFPFVFVIYFLRKRDGRALASALVTIAGGLAISVKVFGWPMHRAYFQSVLPWTLRGEALPPYLLSAASLSNLLHRLFLYEPQWNPHPWHHAPLVFAVAGPVLQMLILGPAILLVGRLTDRRWVPLEWSLLLAATLTISTSPASYNFTLLILPVAVLCEVCDWRKALLALLLFVGIGYPGWNTANADGLRAVLREPRLLLLIAFTGLCASVLWDRQRKTAEPPSQRLIWMFSLGAVTGLGIMAAVLHQRTLEADYAYRLPMRSDALLSADPAGGLHGVEQIQMLADGYFLTPSAVAQPDQLTFRAAPGGDWVEQVGVESRLMPPPGSSYPEIANARNPMLSVDGRTLTYIRDDHGRGTLLQYPDVTLTPAWMNVLDAVPTSGDAYFVAASIGWSPVELFRVEGGQEPKPMKLGVARDPAVSPDGRWLAYSSFGSSAWNLYLLDLRQTGVPRRLTSAACNQVEPVWEADSKTLLYASDCGRALGFTAICRRRVVPEPEASLAAPGHSR